MPAMIISKRYAILILLSASFPTQMPEKQECGRHEEAC
jgi:hypothetical protein